MMQAFPGGNYDPKQDASDYKMTALRETFEETGLLLLSSSPSDSMLPSSMDLSAARKAIHSRSDPTTFTEFLSKHNLSPPPAKFLVPFTQWITPPIVPIRFHAQFYVLFLEDLKASGGLVLDGEERQTQGDGAVVELPSDDGKVEIVEARFLHPDEIFRLMEKGDISLMPPQVYLIKTLGDILRAYSESEKKATKTEMLSEKVEGRFGVMVFRPQGFGFTEEGGVGKRQILAYDGDELRGGEKGDRHRSLVKSAKGGVSFTLRHLVMVNTDSSCL